MDVDPIGYPFDAFRICPIWEVVVRKVHTAKGISIRVTAGFQNLILAHICRAACGKVPLRFDFDVVDNIALIADNNVLPILNIFNAELKIITILVSLLSGEILP